MAVSFDSTCPSKWVPFQAFNTHIRAKNIQVAPPSCIHCILSISNTLRPAPNPQPLPPPKEKKRLVPFIKRRSYSVLGERYPLNITKAAGRRGDLEAPYPGDLFIVTDLDHQLLETIIPFRQPDQAEGDYHPPAGNRPARRVQAPLFGLFSVHCFVSLLLISFLQCAVTSTHPSNAAIYMAIKTIPVVLCPDTLVSGAVLVIYPWFMNDTATSIKNNLH